MGRKGIDWLKDLTFTEVMWFNIRDLAKERGFEHPRAKLLVGKGEKSDRNYLFTSGLSFDQVMSLKTEIEVGGWTHTQTSRKRHFFSKPYATEDNPSLCKRHKLDFITSLEHDLNNEDKCQICFKSYKRKKIVQVIAAGELDRRMLKYLPDGLEAREKEAL